MRTVGYARVRTDHQLLDAQRDALEAAGRTRGFVDQMSGMRRTDRASRSCWATSVNATSWSSCRWTGSVAH